MVDQAVERALRALDASSPPAGEMPVVLAAGSSGILLHEAIGHGMEADFNRKDISIYAEQDGQDHRAGRGHDRRRRDPARRPRQPQRRRRGQRHREDRAGGSGRASVLPARPDQREALRGGRRPAAGRRESFRHPVLPRMRATYMEAGPHDPAEIIAIRQARASTARSSPTERCRSAPATSRSTCATVA